MMPRCRHGAWGAPGHRTGGGSHFGVDSRGIAGCAAPTAPGAGARGWRGGLFRAHLYFKSQDLGCVCPPTHWVQHATKGALLGLAAPECKMPCQVVLSGCLASSSPLPVKLSGKNQLNTGTTTTHTHTFGRQIPRGREVRVMRNLRRQAAAPARHQTPYCSQRGRGGYPQAPLSVSPLHPPRH